LIIKSGERPVNGNPIEEEEHEELQASLGPPELTFLRFCGFVFVDSVCGLTKIEAIMGKQAGPRKENFKGYVQVYTGNGKGKTTAALGLALRAAGHGLRVYIGQFLKGHPYGELRSARKLAPFVRIEQFGRKRFIHVTENPEDEDIDRARRGLEKCRRAMLSQKYQVIILDEVNVALHFRLLSEKEVHAFLDQRPPGVEVVLTGRYASPSLIKRADLVTEMKEKKHYYARGVRARAGIEK